MPLPEGWRRIRKGERGYSASARTYYDPRGRVRSRRAADNERLRSYGWRNKRDFDTRGQKHIDRGYMKWAQMALETGDVDPSEIRRSDSEFNRLFLDFRADPNDKSPTGPLAQLLVAAGLREPEWTWDVDDTPETA